MKIIQTDDLTLCQTLRRIVFVEEQNVPESEEWDGRDSEALHLLALAGDRAIGTARILLRGDIAKIGRVCVLADMRKQGVGAALIRAALDLAAQQPGIVQAKLGAQIHAIGFYQKLGFAVAGPEYDDAGIAHRDMTRNL